MTGALELVSGIRGRRRVDSWVDRVTVGAVTLLLGAVVLVIPPDIADRFSGDKGVEGMITSPIIVVGVLGGWGIVTGVLLAIAAASPRAGAGRSAKTATARIGRST